MSAATAVRVEHPAAPLATQRELTAVALCALVAATVHAVVAAQHGREHWLVGLAFAAVAALQLTLARSVMAGPAARTVQAGIWGTVAVVALYVTSRTAGLPWLGDHHAGGEAHHAVVPNGIGVGTPVWPESTVEPVGVLDLTCLAAELGLLVGLVGMLPSRHRSRTTTAMLILGLVVLLGRVVAVAW